MVYLCDDFSLDKEYGFLTTLATEERIKKASEYKNKKDKALSLLSFLLLQFALKNEFDFILDKEYSFIYNANGKPSLKDDDVKFSISHCEKAVAVGVSLDEIGVDVERIRKINDLTIRKTMQKVEIDEINKDRQLFFKYWCLKEAYIKMRGTSVISDIKYNKYIEENSFCYKYNDYYLACCVKDITKEKVCKVSILDLEKFALNK